MEPRKKQRSLFSEFKSCTIDEKEIQNFSNYSKTWWDLNGPFLGLHTMNQLRVPLIRDCLVSTGRLAQESVHPNKPLKGVSVLDVGCGGGILSEALAKLGYEVTGVDASSELISIAKHHATLDSSLTNLTYLATTIEKHSESHFETYDVVVCSEVIEHVIEQESFLETCVKCLKPGGSIFITTFNKTLTSWWMGIIMIEYILRHLPRGTHKWSKFVSPEDVTKMLEKCNCYTKTVRGMKFELYPAPRHWHWSRDISVNYALHAVKNL